MNIYNYFVKQKSTNMKKKVLILTMVSALVLQGTAGFAVSLPTSTPVSTNAEPDPLAVKAAVAEFKNLSKKERKMRVKAAKAELKKAKSNMNADPSTNTLLLVILAILLPPLAVYLHQGEINSKFWISLLLTLLFWIPGVIYALIVILGEA